MSGKCIVTFDKSNEDIPTLVVGRESFFAFGPGVDVIKVITGDEAVRVWNDLTGQVDIKAKSNVRSATDMLAEKLHITKEEALSEMKAAMGIKAESEDEENASNDIQSSCERRS